MIYVTGDTHGDFTRFGSKTFKEGRDLTKNDYVIICGDFSGIWDVNESKETEKHWLDWLSEKKWKTIFVDGNHENHDRLERMKEVEMFGSRVGKVTDSIFHLKRGMVYTIEDKTFFTFGGGYSIDKSRRTESFSWWPQEMPCYNEYTNGVHRLDAVDNKVDYIITHTCSNMQFDIMSQKFQMNYKVNEPEMPLRRFLDKIYVDVEFKHWYCGHFHVDYDYDNTSFLQDRIKEIK